MLLLASLMTIGSGQLVTWGGKCAAVPLISDFDLAKYGGEWYEQIRYPVVFQDAESKCTKATYGLIDGSPTSVSVNNTAISPVPKQTTRWGRVQKLMEDSEEEETQWYLEDRYLDPENDLGVAVQVEPDTFPNKLNVSFGPSSAIGEYFMRLFGYPNYNVMETDYESYTLVMSCAKFWFFTIEFGWILSREQDFRYTSMFDEVLERAEQEYGYQSDRAIVSKERDCDFQFVEKDGEYIEYEEFINGQ